MNYKYYKLAKKRGIEMLTFRILFISPFLYVFSHHLFFVNFGWFELIMLLLLLLMNVPKLKEVYPLIVNNGAWEIKITNSEIIWNVPKNIGEESFRVKISEISRIIRLVYSVDSYDGYFIEMTNGAVIDLNSTGKLGMDLFLFTKKLEDFGIELDVENYVRR
jgi:hypothetical protein